MSQRLSRVSLPAVAVEDQPAVAAGPVASHHLEVVIETVFQVDAADAERSRSPCANMVIYRVLLRISEVARS